MKRYLVALAICIIIASLCLLVLDADGQTIEARYVVGDIPVYHIALPDSFKAVAFTNCDSAGHPYIVMDTVRIGMNYSSILIHELKHVEQYEHFRGGCVEYQKKYANDGNFRLRTEIEAECAELKSKNLNTFQFQVAVAERTAFYWSLRNRLKFPMPNLPYSEYLSRFTAVCGGG